MALLEHVPHQAVVLAQVDAITVAGEDAGGILAAMLQDQQAVVDGLIHRTLERTPMMPHMQGKPLVLKEGGAILSLRKSIKDFWIGRSKPRGFPCANAYRARAVTKR